MCITLIWRHLISLISSMRAGIERELASRADQRVLRWFGHVERMDERVGQKGVNGRSKWGMGTRETEVRLDSLWEGGLGQWRWRLRINARKIGKSGKPWYICNWTSFKRPFFLGNAFFVKKKIHIFFFTVLPCSGGYHLERGLMPLHDADGINCKKGATNYKKSNRRCQVYGLRQGHLQYRPGCTTLCGWLIYSFSSVIKIFLQYFSIEDTHFMKESFIKISRTCVKSQADPGLEL